MDGTGLLFNPFLERLPDAMKTKVIRYPEHIFLSYEQLETLVINQLPVSEKYIIIAESFSGPIALRIASRATSNLEAIVLISSFAYRPLGWIGTVLARLPLKALFRRLPSDFILRSLLLGHSAPQSTLVEARQAITRVRPEVLAGRLREALTSDYGRHHVPGHIRILTIFAGQDRLLGNTARKSLAQVCPDAETEFVPAPHLALQAAPGIILTTLIKHTMLGFTETQQSKASQPPYTAP